TAAAAAEDAGRKPGPEPGRELRPGVVLLGTTGETDRSYPWASVTKLCTALAVLVAVEEGTLALSDPAGPPGATVAHLLAHASGLAPDDREPIASPGTRRIYSNAGYEVLGELLSERAAMPVWEYVEEAVFAPAGMAGVRLAPGASPAYGAEGTLADLLALGAELLAPRLVAPETLDAATNVAFPGLAGVLPGFGHQDPNDWGLGFELRDAKHPHWTGSSNSAATFGHFGRSGSFLWIDPEARIACGALSDRAFGPWAADAWPALSDAVLRTLAGFAGDSDD
ncbi:MAG: serine hydrolase domain-containing protein, partial [Acidimicrobiales bacterium]